MTAPRAGVGLRSGRGRRVARKGAPPARRGATLALVAVMIVVLVGMAALAIDVGRMRLAAAELQTAADAAALGAARAVQREPWYASSAGPNAAITVGAKNRAYGAAAGIAGADVQPVAYAASGGAVTAASWSSATAVEVTARAQGSYLLGRVTGAPAPPSVARRATAWIANVNGAACLKPFVLPYSDLYHLALGGSGSAPDFTQTHVALISTLPPSYRSFVLIRPYARTTNGYEGVWSDADFTGQRSTARLGDWVAGRNCATAKASVATSIATGVDTGQVMVDAVTANIGALCNFRGASDARCYSSATATAPGVEVRAPWGDVTRTSGNVHPAASIRMVSLVRVMCYFRATTDVCSPVPSYPGGGWSPPHQTTGYPPGTIVFLIDGPTSIDLTPDVVLGNRVSFTQRLILTR